MRDTEDAVTVDAAMNVVNEGLHSLAGAPGVDEIQTELANDGSGDAAAFITVIVKDNASGEPYPWTRWTLVGPRREVSEAATRWFAHGTMADACKLFTGPTVGGKLAKTAALAGVPVGQELQDVARAFLSLQQARHEADYDMSSKRFTRQRTQQLIEQAEQVLLDWDKASADPWRAVFMLLLLTGDGVVVFR